MQKINEMDENSAFIGRLPHGCTLCGPGMKMVLLITGKCMRRCFYCPLSFKKRGKNVIYANELKVKNLDEIISEADTISAKGTGITGGDPMFVPERTLEAIKLLKNNFGTKHHIHLYTAGEFDPKYIKKLTNDGLDELRLHPPIASWSRIHARFKSLIDIAIDSGLQVGAEIPVLPGYVYEKVIIKFAHGLRSLGANFLNLNELEFSESNWEKLMIKGYTQKYGLSNTVKGSSESAHKILHKLAEEDDNGLNVHYCSAKFKDRQQLTNRIKRRAKNVIKPNYVLTDDGTFLIGIIEMDQFKGIRELRTVQKNFMKIYGVPQELIKLDQAKHRLEIASWVLEKLKLKLNQNLKGRCFIIEEYPTADRLEVERIPLNEFK